MKKLISLLLGLALLSGLWAMSAFAAAGDTYALTDASVTVNGTADKTVTVCLVANRAGTVYGLQGLWITAAGEGMLTLSELTPGSSVSGITENSAASGNVLWLDSGFSNGIAVAAGGTIWTAAYTVDKDTPSGEYTVSLDVTSIIKDSNKGDKGIGTLTATVTVTNVTPTPEPAYAVGPLTVRSPEGAVLSAIPAGDFLVTVPVTKTAGEGDCLVFLAAYGASGQFRGLLYVQLEDVPEGAAVKVTLPAENAGGGIGSLKAFCVASFGNLTPLGEAAAFPAD